jgi:hypothetical protein
MYCSLRMVSTVFDGINPLEDLNFSLERTYRSEEQQPTLGIIRQLNFKTEHIVLQYFPLRYIYVYTEFLFY